MLKRHGFATLILCCLFTASARSQERPSPLTIDAGLRSTSASEVAWAAFDAGTLHLREAIPRLVSVLESPPDATPWEHYCLAAAVLDALVQIDTERRLGPDDVPSALLAPYLTTHPIPTLILLERAGMEREAFLLERLSHLSGGDQWFALANLLLTRSPTGFASQLLNGLSLTLTVVVQDDVARDGGSGFGQGFGGGTSDPPGSPRAASFPPHAVYSFTIRYPGATLLSTGPRDVYYQRVLFTSPEFPIAREYQIGPTDDDRLAYLSAILSPGYRFPLPAHTWVTTKWRTWRTLLEEIDRARRSIERLHDALLDQLVAGKHLTEQQRSAFPLRLRTEIVDERGDRSRPLPPAP